MAKTNRDPQDLQLKGIDNASASVLAENVQKWIDSQISDTQRLNIAERYFWQPMHSGAQHSALIFFTIEPKEPKEIEQKENSDETPKAIEA